MKKTKFAVLFTALIATCGLSSCLGDPDPYNYGTEYVKVVPSLYGYSFKNFSKYTLNPTDQSLISSTFFDTEYAWINYKYKREDLVAGTSEINIELQTSPVAIKELYYSPMESEGNSYIDYVGLSQFAFPFYDANTMFLDIQYDIKDVESYELSTELAKHSLSISRVNEDCTSEKVVLKLNHEELESSEGDEDVKKGDYGDIRYVNLYSLLNGQTPDKLVIRYNKSTNSDKTELDSCVVSYKEIVNTYFNNGSSM